MRRPGHSGEGIWISDQGRNWPGRISSQKGSIPLISHWNFCLLQAEIAEAFHEWRKGGTNIGEGLADAAISLLGLAGMTGIDLQAEVEARLAKNAARIYQRRPDNALAKHSGESGR
jgi:NTP pyrophosphatase (non-canonical NTP hydrolase)